MLGDSHLRVYSEADRYDWIEQGDTLVGNVFDTSATGTFVKLHTITCFGTIFVDAPTQVPPAPGLYYSRFICKKWCGTGDVCFSSRILQR